MAFLRCLHIQAAIGCLALAGCASAPDADTNRHMVDGYANPADRKVIKSTNERIFGAEQASNPDAEVISNGTQGVP